MLTQEQYRAARRSWEYDPEGPYQIDALTGEGGMGEVYRARDTKLDRDVAIKVLPDAFASDPERLARLHADQAIDLDHEAAVA